MSDATRNLTDKATYERLEKDVTAVKNDIAALTEQITDALNNFAGTAGKQARRGYKQARASAEQAIGIRARLLVFRRTQLRRGDRIVKSHEEHGEILRATVARPPAACAPTC